MKLESRHWTFLGLLIVVVGAMLLGIRPNVTISDDTQRMFEYIDSLPEGSILIYSFDHESSSLPEIRPAALGALAAFIQQGTSDNRSRVAGRRYGHRLPPHGYGGIRVRQAVWPGLGLSWIQTAVYRGDSLDGRIDRKDIPAGLFRNSL